MKTSATRLLRLADRLEAHADEMTAAHSFRMEEFVGRGHVDATGTVVPDPKKDRLSDKVPVPADCGFAACACGWAGLFPENRAEGFTTQGGQVYYWPPDTHELYSSWDAVEEFFGINRSQSRYLFSAHTYNPDERGDPRRVAVRLRKFVQQECGRPVVPPLTYVPLDPDDYDPRG